MFNFSTKRSATAQELEANAMTYDSQIHQRNFQRAGYRALKQFRKAGPLLAGQPVELFYAIVDVIKGLQAADFDRDSERAALAADGLEKAIDNLITAQPVPFGLDTLKNGNAYTRGQVLVRERDKSMCLLSIPQFEIRSGARNERNQAISDFSILAVHPNVDAPRMLNCINRMHFAAVDMFLESFAADIPEPMEEFQAAVDMAKSIVAQAEERHAALGVDKRNEGAAHVL